MALRCARPRQRPMNRNIFLIAIVAAGLLGTPAVAQEYGPARWFRHDDDERVEGSRWGLRRDVDRINRMLSHVRYEMQRYTASRRFWSAYRDAEADVNQANYLFRRGADRDRV